MIAHNVWHMRWSILLTIIHEGFADGGALYTWGSNNGGRLGLEELNWFRPQQQALNGTVTGIALGSSTSAAVVDGSVYSWGYSGCMLGQCHSPDRVTALGLGPTEVRCTPTLVNIPGKVTAIPGTSEHRGAIADGRLYMWGRNSQGQLGLGDTVDRATPIHVPGLPGNVSAIHVQCDRSIAVVNGSVYWWGAKFFGLIDEAHTPQLVDLPGPATAAVIGAGGLDLRLLSSMGHSIAGAQTVMVN